MSSFRIAVVNPDDTVFQWRSPLDTIEDAQARLGDAQAEYPDAVVRVEQLVAGDLDADGNVLNMIWTEVA